MTKYYNDNDLKTEIVKKRRPGKSKGFSYEDDSIRRLSSYGKTQRKNLIKDYESGVLGEEEF